MDPLRARQTRSERLVAVGRLVLAASSLVAIWLDPAEPAKYAHATYALLAGYLVYALLLTAWAALSESFNQYVCLITHLVDLAIFGLLLYLTEGSASPLFVYFVFALLAAALRWGWRGVLWTALAALAIYIGVSLYAERVLLDPAFELNRFIIRCVYLAVVALLLGYLSAYEWQLRRELVELAAWPRHVPQEARLRETLRHAATVLGAERVLMVWDETEEPWRYRATFARGHLECVREPSDGSEPLVAEPLTASDFLCLNADQGEPTVLYLGARGIERWTGVPLAAGWQARLGCRSILALRVEGEGENFAGRLLVPDKPALTTDDLVLAGIVARQVAADLDQFYLQERLHRAAVAEERVRFARELHDGLLQSLTGLALRLRSLRHFLDTDRAAAHAGLAEVESLLAAEQRDLRFLVRQLKPLPLSPSEVNAGLANHLRELAERVERQWGLRVELALEPLARELPEPLAHAAYRILQECLANSARHGRATLARARLGVRDGRLRIEVSDDGSGFPFRGRYDLAALDAMRQGPRSVMQRVTSQEGHLVIDSDESGARLEIELPLQPTPPTMVGMTSGAG
ncbi:MAG TPA: histidine kinase [Geminicoccaceae bacterium]|nr:histidine kinase [Geminicoccaceae bacterium]